MIIKQYFGSTSENAQTALKKISDRIFGYVELMHLQNYMLTEQNSVRTESMTDHPRI